MSVCYGLLGLALLFIALIAAPWKDGRGSLVCVVGACVCGVLMMLIGFGLIRT